MFSPWEYNIDKAAERLLAAAGWNSPAPDQYPTGGELVGAVSRAAGHAHAAQGSHPHQQPGDQRRPRGFDKMKSNGRAFEPFTIRYQNGKGPEQLKADAVIDATGTWFSPNPAGADGLPAIGEDELQDRIAYGMPDVLGRERARYAGKTVAVLGAGHSAIGTLIDLARLKDEAPATEIVWLLRGDNPREGLRRRRQRQAGRTRRAGRGLRQPGGERQDRVETGFRVSHLEPRRRASCASAPARRAAAALPPSTSWWWRPASAPSSISCARCGCRSIRQWNARRRWRR